MDINEITIGQLKELRNFGGVSNPKKIPFEVGKCYFFRSDPFHKTGRVKEIVGDFLILEDAAWIADSGRLYDALKNETFSEVEPYPRNMVINMLKIDDATEITTLPREQK